MGTIPPARSSRPLRGAWYDLRRHGRRPPSPPLARWRGPLFVFGAALLWSSGGLGIKFLAGDLSALAITGWRSFFALPLLFVAAGMLRGGGRVLRRGELQRDRVHAVAVAGGGAETNARKGQ